VITDGASTVLPAPTARLEPPQLRAGARGRLVVIVDIPPGMHLQSHDPTEPFLIPTRLHLDPTPEITVGPVEYPTPRTQQFDWTPVQLDVHQGTIEIVVPITIAPSHEGGATTITAHLGYQACTESLCLPPAERQIEATLDIEP
jgi:DsbC/DsbD-like thiol-disulfide interchange protein